MRKSLASSHGLNERDREARRKAVTRSQTEANGLEGVPSLDEREPVCPALTMFPDSRAFRGRGPEEAQSSGRSLRDSSMV